VLREVQLRKIQITEKSGEIMWSRMRLKASRFKALKEVSKEDVIETTLLLIAVLMFVTANSCQL